MKQLLDNFFGKDLYTFFPSQKNQFSGSVEESITGNLYTVEVTPSGLSTFLIATGKESSNLISSSESFRDVLRQVIL